MATEIRSLGILAFALGLMALTLPAAAVQCEAGTDNGWSAFKPDWNAYRETEAYCKFATSQTKHGDSKAAYTDYTRTEPSTYTDGQFYLGTRDGTWMTTTNTGALLATCTYDEGTFTGGSAGCPEAVIEFAGTGGGGTVGFSVAGIQINVLTQPGMTDAEIALIAATTINLHPLLGGVTAKARGARLEITADASGMLIADSSLGYSASAGSMASPAGAAVPVLSPTGILGLFGLLLAAGAIARSAKLIRS